MHRQTKAYIYTGATILIWATVASAFKISLRYLNHLQLLFFASLFSLIIFFIILLSSKRLSLLRNSSKKDLFRSALLGFLNPFLYYLVLFKAYSLLPAQEAQPLNQTWAIVLSIMSIILLRQRITLLNISALFISFLGVIIVSTHGDIANLRFTDTLGVVLALGSAVIWALFWIYNVKDRRDVIAKLFLNFAFGVFFIFILLLITDNLSLPGMPGWIGAAYVGAFEMGITFVLWLRALNLSKTTAQVSNMIYLVPFLSLMVIHFTIGEKILSSTFIGLVFIVAGIILQRTFSVKQQKLY